MAFKDIVGNDRIKHILRRSLQKQRLPNSLLLAGPDGVGKRQTAYVLAKALCCRRLKDDACEECGPCRAISQAESGGPNKYPDVIEMGAEKDVIKIESMREMKSLAYLRPIMGERRVFIIDDAEKMSTESANSVLKVLEEPPAFTHIILTTSHPDQILPTIKSRCRVLNFSPISQLDIEKDLRERGLGDDQAKIVSLVSRGNLDEARETDWDELKERRQAAWEMFRALLRKDNASVFLESYGFLKRKDALEELPQVMEIFSSLCRDLVIIKEGGDPRLLLNPDYETALRQEAEAVTLGQVQEFLGFVERLLSGLDQGSLNTGLLVSTFYSSIMNRS